MKRIVLLVAVLALGCSGSHHNDGSQPPEAFSKVDADRATWGVWTCVDKCGHLPPKQFQIAGWASLELNDVCGSAFDCRYNCSATCEK